MTPEPLNTPAYARLRDRLRGEIMAGEWPAGTHRTHAELAARHGVSQSPVREALLALEGEGLVQLRQHRGAVVPVISQAMLADLYDVRGALQSLLARRAAERATAPQIAVLAGCQALYGEAARAGDAPAALTHNEAFHAAIEVAAGNAQASALYFQRSAFVNTVRLRLGFGTARMAEADRQHQAILAAIAAHDAEAAAAAAFTHAMAAKADLLARVAEDAT